MSTYYKNRTVAIATKHGKENVIFPLLQTELGIANYILPELDTDQFGTFSGEKEREGSPLETLRKKCDAAFAMTQCPLTVASEGSFGPHPSIYFVPANDEWMLLKDHVNQIEVVVRELSLNTNFNGAVFKSWDEVQAFAERCHFPAHGLIVRAGEKDYRSLQKGIQCEKTLKDAVEMCLDLYGQVYVETDMRAYMNPTRMEVIRMATEKLIRKAQSLCPSCQLPGFDVVALQEGLPCSLCHTPTHSILYLVKGCTHCGHFQYDYFPKQQQTAGPETCPRCNP